MKEIFRDERVYGDYRGPDTNRSTLVVEIEGEHLNMWVEDGDRPFGRGAEKQSANHELSFEQCRAMLEVLAPILYG